MIEEKMYAITEAAIGVSTKPGAIQFTRIPSAAHSQARLFVN